jgi:hypothetical protein
MLNRIQRFSGRWIDAESANNACQIKEICPVFRAIR